MGRNNFPNVTINDIPEDFTASTVQSLRELADLGKPATDAELSERIDRFFLWCQQTGSRPGIESLCLALGVTRTTLFKWNNGTGCTPARQQIIQQAKAFIAAFLEQASLQGRLNPATSIFLMKNWMDYKDTVSFEGIAAQEKPGAIIEETREQIGIRYADAVKPELPDFEEFD